MEVFVAFSKEEQIPILEQTMERWAECELIKPVGIRAPGKYEMVRRITADNMAEGQYYILADLGCVPGEGFNVSGVLKRLSATDAEAGGSRELGLVGFGKEGRELEVPTGVRVCRKGAVGRWIPKTTDSYDQEHANAVQLAGKNVTIWTDVTYKHLLEC